MRTDDECSLLSLLDRFDHNDDGQISWEELNSECKNDVGFEASASFIELCNSPLHERSSQSSAYLNCRDEHSSLLVRQISLDDPVVAEMFCDILVEQGCSSSTMVPPSPPLLPLVIATATLFVVSLMASLFVWNASKRKVSSRTDQNDSVVGEDEESDSDGTEVNDFSASEHEWSSIGSGGSRTDGSSSMFPGQVVRRVAQGRIVADEDILSLKKGEGESVEALALPENAVYDFETIDGAEPNENNTSVYFDCIPFPSSSAAL